MSRLHSTFSSLMSYTCLSYTCNNKNVSIRYAYPKIPNFLTIFAPEKRMRLFKQGPFRNKTSKKTYKQ